MTKDDLKNQLNNNPTSIEFSEIMKLIDELYTYTPTKFTNGPEVINEPGSNEGSCRIFAFAQDQQLTEEQTLHCFGTYYRNDVLGNPEGTDHANIRSFMQHGWKGIQFEQPALVEK